MKIIQDSAAFFFIAAVAFLSLISVLGVWSSFDRDVITKSFETLGLLAIVSVVVIIASRYIEIRKGGEAVPVYVPHPAFHSLRRVTLAVLIMLAAILAFLGIMAIWDLVPDMDVLWKSLGSLAVLAFGSFLIVMTCLEREKIPTTNPDGSVSSPASGNLVGTIIAALIGGWLILWSLGSLI